MINPMLPQLKLKASQDTIRREEEVIVVMKVVKQSKSGALASVFLCHLKEGKCYRRKGNVNRMLVKISL